MARAGLTPRVEDLEEQQEKLEKIVTRLRRDQLNTRKQMRELGQRVDQILPGVNEKLDEQTRHIERHVSDANDATKQFVTAAVVDVARQWPAAAVMAVSAVTALGIALIVNLLLAVARLPHLS